MDLRHPAPLAAASECAQNGLSAIEAKMPRILQKLSVMWGEPEFEPYVAHLLMDTRDGTRQGFPWDVAEELLFLHEISIAKRAMVAAAITGLPYRQVFRNMRLNAEAAMHKPHTAWTDPHHNQDARRVHHAMQHTPPRRAALTRKPKPWWKKLLAW